jgi:uncharacterized protein (TIGR03083 family)
MARTLESLAGAFDRQAVELIGWLGELDPADFDRPSVLPAWNVRMLVAHLVVVRAGLSERMGVPGTAPAVQVAEYVGRYGPAAGAVDEATELAAGELTGPQLVGRFATLPSAADAVRGVVPKRVLGAPRGPLTALDWMATRLVELVAHADDLTRSLPAREPVPLVRSALAEVSRELTRIFAAQVPGHSVEVRVPPFAAVQAVPGPSHTRGTPPSVVETDPVTWVRLATGRLGYHEAVAAALVKASGQRSDLGAHLPVLR